MSDYRTGYYDGWVACLAMMDKLSSHYVQQMEREGMYLIEDGTLHGNSIHLAYGYAEEACERYAYSTLLDWQAGHIDQEKPPPFPKNIIDAY